jgi:hypothetical protein
MRQRPDRGRPDILLRIRQVIDKLRNIDGLNLAKSISSQLRCAAFSKPYFKQPVREGKSLMSRQLNRMRCSDPTCGTWLDAELPNEAFALLTTFPDNLIRCLAQLFLCQYGHKNILPSPALVVNKQRTSAVLYLPPELVDRADAIEAGLRIRLTANCLIVCVSDQRGFRRAFWEKFLADHTSTLNEFAFRPRRSNGCSRTRPA